MSNYLIEQETRRCKRCLVLRKIPQDFYVEASAGGCGVKYKGTCKVCCRQRTAQRNSVTRQLAARLDATPVDPAILLYRAEKRKAGPRLRKRAKEYERKMHQMVERMAQATTYGFYITPRDLSA